MKKKNLWLILVTGDKYVLTFGWKRNVVFNSIDELLATLRKALESLKE